MVPEAPLEQTANGLVPTGEGWFVLDVREAQWFDGGGLGGLYTSFEGVDARFAELGFGLGILRPGEANALYHGEEAQENFLVLAGECLLLIEGRSGRCAPGTSFTARPGWSTSSSVQARARAWCSQWGRGEKDADFAFR